MDQKLQNKILKYSLGLIILLFFILIIVFNQKNINNKSDIQDLKRINENLAKQNKKDLEEIDKSKYILSSELKKRDSLIKVINSLNKGISSKTKELSLVKDRYKTLDLDSLLKIATKRYEKDKHITILPD